MSTFKHPVVNRKGSRSRFSTTTIWEMSVNKGNDETRRTSDSAIDNMHTSVVDDDLVPSRKQSEGRERRLGVANNKLEGQVETRQCYQDDGESENDTYDMDVSVASHNKQDMLSPTRIQVISAKPENGIHDFNSDTSSNDSVKHEQPTHTNDQIEIEDKNKQSDDEQIPPSGDEDRRGDKWNKVRKVVRFVRPVYKQLNLDNVTCKVPKGKSDPKDCLSKDPVYVGWAKMVGRRIKTKTVKKPDGEEQTVTVREGRSLPAILQQNPIDVSAYTRSVSNKFPPHQLGRKRMSIDVNGFQMNK